ncbi:MAG: hypothetical protein EA361_13835 [Bacteroidetes bacterium]|nr:MAG: hypothetical protein EA361_13835 [Bacteroidota bacterium]
MFVVKEKYVPFFQRVGKLSVNNSGLDQPKNESDPKCKVSEIVHAVCDSAQEASIGRFLTSDSSGKFSNNAYLYVLVDDKVKMSGKLIFAVLH